MVLGLGKDFSSSASLLIVLRYWDSAKDVILSTPMKFFFLSFFLAARHPANFDGCPTAGAKATGLGITDTMASVPHKASTAPQSAVLAL